MAAALDFAYVCLVDEAARDGIERRDLAGIMRSPLWGEIPQGPSDRPYDDGPREYAPPEAWLGGLTIDDLPDADE